MQHLFAKYGLIKHSPSSSNLEADARRSKTVEGDSFGPFSFGGQDFRSRKSKRKARDLKKLSLSALPSRAITLIRNGISSLVWAVQPKGNLLPQERLDEYRGSIETVRNVLENPNPEDDDFPTFIGQVVEDLLVFDAGCWEYVESPRFLPQNRILSLAVVPGDTMEKRISWDGNPESVRWRQMVGEKPEFKDREIEYLMHRKRSHSAFGYSPLEAAADIMDAWLGLASYQRSVASTAYPAFMMYLGESVKKEQAHAMRTYWRTELRGRGEPGMWGNTGQPKVLELKPAGDEGLYLLYQEMLVRILAFCFGLKPQDFGIERDVNRSTSQVSQKASVQEALLPVGVLIQSRINARVIPRIADLSSDERIRELRFFYVDIDPRDRKTSADIHRVYLENDALTLDEVRKERNLSPLPNSIGELTVTAAQELFKRDPLALINGISEAASEPASATGPLQS